METLKLADLEAPKLIDRRQFTVASAMAILTGVVITITGCGSSSSSPTSPTPVPTPGPGDKVGTISGNHGHSAIITAASLTAGGALSLDIRGSADHTHTVSLTGADLTSISANQRVSKESTNESSHSHTVTFN